ncbi:MAG: hypothetical protein IT198_04900 [Acidimicrobiia bacterium]|nr:hypothetical protein [Acidimicrobiia bacterium]
MALSEGDRREVEQMMDEKITAQDARMYLIDRDLRDKIEETNSRVVGLATQLNALTRRVEQGFHRLDDRLDHTDDRVDRLGARFDRLEARFDRFETKVEERFDNLETRFDRLEERITRLEMAIQRLIDGT